MQLVSSIARTEPPPMSDHRDPLVPLAEQIAADKQRRLGEEPVPFDLWPSDKRAKMLYSARVADRWDDLRARRDAELYARQTFALVRYRTPYEELAPRQQNAINTELHAILTVFGERLMDHEFPYLGHDQRAVLEPELHAKAAGGVM